MSASVAELRGMVNQLRAGLERGVSPESSSVMDNLIAELVRMEGVPEVEGVSHDIKTRLDEIGHEATSLAVVQQRIDEQVAASKAKQVDSDNAAGSKPKPRKASTSGKSKPKRSGKRAANPDNDELKHLMNGAGSDALINLGLDEESLYGFLLYEAGGATRRANVTTAVVRIAELLRDKLCHDPEAGVFGVWTGTHWQMDAGSNNSTRVILRLVFVGCGALGFTPSYGENITKQIVDIGLLQRPALVTGVVPFLNGLLDYKSGQLTPATPSYSTDYVLPHKYDPEATCPNIDAWLLGATDGDAPTVELLNALMAAMIFGIPVQKLLIILGTGGSGKGVFQRLMVVLVGEQNMAVSTIYSLENYRFELAKHYRKRLCLINEAGYYGKPLPVIKAMTGGDYLPFEKKNVQQTGSFVYEGLLVMATNDDIASSDSGVERRRITVAFDKEATKEQKADWVKRGGEAAVIHAEIPGLINKLLKLSVAEIHSRLENLPERVKASNHESMLVGNSIADWMVEECVFEPSATSTMGKRNSNDSLSDPMIYPAYCRWCEGVLVRPEPQRYFKKQFFAVAAQLGYSLSERQCIETRRILISGVRVNYLSKFSNSSSIAPRSSNGAISASQAEHSSSEHLQNIFKNGKKRNSGAAEAYRARSKGE